MQSSLSTIFTQSLENGPKGYELISRDPHETFVIVFDLLGHVRHPLVNDLLL